MSVIERYKSQRINLTAARDRQELIVSGHSLSVLDASPGARLTVQIQERDTSPRAVSLILGQGASWSHIPFDRLFLTNAAQAAGWIDLAIWGAPDETDPKLFAYRPADPEGANPIDVAWIDFSHQVTGVAPGTAFTAGVGALSILTDLWAGCMAGQTVRMLDGAAVLAEWKLLGGAGRVLVPLGGPWIMRAGWTLQHAADGGADVSNLCGWGYTRNL